MPIFDFIGVRPGYREFDVSSWFLIFMTIFFAMIFGDGGYGRPAFVGVHVFGGVGPREVVDAGRVGPVPEPAGSGQRAFFVVAGRVQREVEGARDVIGRRMVIGDLDRPDVVAEFPLEVGGVRSREVSQEAGHGVRGRQSKPGGRPVDRVPFEGGEESVTVRHGAGSCCVAASPVFRPPAFGSGGGSKVLPFQRARIRRPEGSHR